MEKKVNYKRVKRGFVSTFKREPNIKNPQNLSDKLFGRKLGYQDPFITKITDKVYAKEYIKGKTFVEPIPTIFSGQPEFFTNRKYPFIAKPNNASGRTRFVRNDSEWEEFAKSYKQWEDEPYSLDKGEWNYWGIDQQALIEPVLKDTIELKMFVIHNRVELIEYMRPRVMSSYNANNSEMPEKSGVSFFDRGIKKLPVKNAKYPVGDDAIPERVNVEFIMDAAEKLSEGLDFIRIDFIWTPELVYFGEFSYFVGGGLLKWKGEIDLDKHLGKLL